MKRLTLFLILGSSLLLALLPVFVYWLNFGFNSLSRNYSDWIGFGNYIGGTVGPIVSLLSLLILGWITFMVAGNSSKESFKQQIILKRMDAYQQLVNHQLKLNLFRRQAGIYNQYMSTLNRFPDSLGPKDLADSILNIQNNYTTLHEYYQFIFSFKLTYGHLYQYDFDSNEFKRLLKSSKEVEQFATELEQAIIAGDYEKIKSVKSPDDFLDGMVDFINSLRKEMDLQIYL